jgi:hypothetical protein
MTCKNCWEPTEDQEAELCNWCARPQEERERLVRRNTWIAGVVAIFCVAAAFCPVITEALK